MGSMFSKASPEQDPRDQAQVGQKRVAGSDQEDGSSQTAGKASVSKKRFKTAKERKSHFKNTRTWTDDEPKRPKQEDGEKEARFPKRKVALLFGYSGTGYYGLQFNPNVPTIEQALFDALVKARAISKDNSTDPKKVQWGRTARTDKGVHAAGNIVSFKMQLPLTGKELVDSINEHLPEQIRVWDYVEVFRSFHAKTMCDSRVYEYLLPSYAFAPPLSNGLSDTPTSDTDVIITNHDRSITKYARVATDEERQRSEQYQISDEQLQNFRDVMAKFEGTHNFHNYTSGRKYNEQASKRHLLSIKVSDPFMIDRTEWLSVKLHGQSFMLNQIRKMISMGVLVVRHKSPLSLIERTFEDKKINIPKAPALGLLLEQPVFQTYNKKVDSRRDADEKKKKEDQPTQQKVHEYINFDANENDMNAFKSKYIYTQVFESEQQERGFETFLLSVDNSLTQDFDYLHSQDGMIPDQCIITTKFTIKQESDDEEQDEDDDKEEKAAKKGKGAASKAKRPAK
ncbi:tRNA pseudouridine synthase [Hesseltinella vesiculosa]|uniref:tRNA pseudouridine synthase n=1 Tax=Hesseltinella vesiculosa TaxID=101127 RepID=A0A1X2G5X0_9FUNG|nr:tRNA pseudouridine synthase [Hesseltinella vesiculosa]